MIKWLKDRRKFWKWLKRNPLITSIYCNLDLFKFSGENVYFYEYAEKCDDFLLVIEITLGHEIHIQKIHKKETTVEEVPMSDEDTMYFRKKLSNTPLYSKTILWDVQRCFYNSK